MLDSSQLGLLSDQLRTYHHLGTPKLSFPKSKSRTDTPRNRPRTQSVDQAMHANASSPSSPPFQTSPRSINISPDSPAFPIFRSQSSQPTSRSPPISVHALTPDKHIRGSNLSAMYPREDHPSSPLRWDADRENAREHLEISAEAWVEPTPRGLKQAGRATLGTRAVMGWTDSPMELTDRSRPW